MRKRTVCSLLILVFLTASVTIYFPAKAQLLDTFTLSASPSTLSVMQGDSGQVYISVNSINNFSAPVSLSFSDAPIGVSISFDNNPVTPPPGGADSSTAYFSVDASVTASNYQMTLVGTSGSDVKNYDFTLQVTARPTPGDFGIGVSPQSVSTSPGGSASATATITSIDGFSSPVTLSATGQPPGVSVTFSPGTVTPSAGGSADSAVSLSVANDVSQGFYPITITGSGGGGVSAVIIEHSTELDLQVSSPQDFTITVTPSSVSSKQGQSTTATVTVSAIGGFSAQVGLSTGNGVPSGVQVGFSPNPILPGSSTMSITVASSANTGTFNFQVVGTSGALSHATTFTLTISQASQPSFSLSSSSGSIALPQGGNGKVTIIVSSINGFSSPVTTYTTWVGPTPTGITISGPGTLTPPSGKSTSGTLTLSAAPSASVGNYLLSVVGTSGSLATSTNVGVQIGAGVGDFSISLSPSSVTLMQGSTVSSTLTIRSSGTFSSAVTLSASSPSGLTISFANNPVVPPAGGKASTQVTLTASGSFAGGTYPVPILGISGSLSHSTTITVTVSQALTPDFTVAANPSMISISQGSTASSVITALSQDGFSSPVTLTASWQTAAPSGVNFNLPGPVTPQPNAIGTSTLTISVGQGSSIGTYTIIVSGSSGPLIHNAPITLEISGSYVTTSTQSSTSSSSTTTSAPGPKCFIATATFGSAMAPEVQFLRNLRDKDIMNTYVGWNFMIAFNAWYYSFSPTVAESITQHPTLQYAMRVVLYPLIAILRLGATPFILLPTHQEIAAVLSGILITSLIGVVYLSLPMAAISKYGPKRRSISKSILRILAAYLALSLAGIAIAELATLGQLMIVATVSAALSTLLLSALVTSEELLHIINRRAR